MDPTESTEPTEPTDSTEPWLAIERTESREAIDDFDMGFRS
jgi:hypothetical protein